MIGFFGKVVGAINCVFRGVGIVALYAGHLISYVRNVTQTKQIGLWLPERGRYIHMPFITRHSIRLSIVRCPM